MSRRGISLIPGSRVLRGSAVRRATEWFSSQSINEVAIPQAGAVVFSFSVASLSGLVPFTIVRTRGSVAGNTSTNVVMAGYNFGVMIVRDEALTAGIASLPTPLDNFGSDGWFLLESIMIPTEGVGEGQRVLHRMIDVKSMRKVVDGDAIVGVAQSLNANSITHSHSLRMLAMLH